MDYERVKLIVKWLVGGSIAGWVWGYLHARVGVSESTGWLVVCVMAAIVGSKIKAVINQGEAAEEQKAQ